MHSGEGADRYFQRDAVPLSERGKYQAVIGSVFGVSTVAGPLLGGLFVQHHGRNPGPEVLAASGLPLSVAQAG